MKTVRYTFRLFIIGATLLSFVATYYVHIIKKDYIIFALPNGPDTSDYFIEE